MKIVSCNVNGVRSAWKKGLGKFIKKEAPDILCLQELKAQKRDIPDKIKEIQGFKLFLNVAERKGYSGVAVYAKREPKSLFKNLDLARFDGEGRMLRLDYSNFILINLYMPHGRRDKKDLRYKLSAYKKLIQYISELKDENVILTGDFNVAHTPLDLARPKNNKNNIMFSPEERLCLDKILEIGLRDTFRIFNDGAGHYTWWPNSYDCRQRNVGWRLDYCFASFPFAKKIKKVEIHRNVEISDHCPISIEVDV